MYSLAIFIGFFSYVIFVLGLFGVISKNIIQPITIGFLFFLIIVFWARIKRLFKYNEFLKNPFLTCLFALISVSMCINLIGALGPETAFDALWYHLTLPKLYIIYHKIFFIPGGLLYYSAMPKLGEMLYTAGLSFGSETYPKLIHYAFGILSCLALYSLSKKFFSKTFSLLVVLLFYTNLVVSWESITAYVDLIRTFYEIVVLSAWINWAETQKTRWLYLSAVLVGLAITTKYLAIGSLFILVFLTIIHSINQHISTKKIIRNLIYYIVLTFVIPLPWTIFSYVNTGNFVYPFFTTAYPVQSPFHLLNPALFLRDVWTVFTSSQDPISPVYIGILPLLILFFPRAKKYMKYIYIYGICAVIVWYFTPRTGGGRFMLPYLPMLSIICVDVISKSKKNLQHILIGFVLLASIVNIAYRTAANIRYIPFLLGKETKSNFLAKTLNFSFGDFYDINGYFLKTIKQNDKALLLGFHNLYYVDFPFVDSSWAKKGEKYNYIAIQNGQLSSIDYPGWKKVYYNQTTKVSLYKK